jgi:2-dehydropantoate 2-reductase
MLARGGRDVHFLMKRDLADVRARGLRIASPRGDFHLPVVRCAGTTAEIGPVDLVIIALKATSNASLEGLIPPLLREGTTLLTLQNGLGSDEFLAGHFGSARVMGGLCFVCLNRTGPGEITHVGEGRISLGEFEGYPLPRTRALAAEFERCGVPCAVVDNLARERWRKLVWNVPFNGLSIAGGGIDVARILADEGLLRRTRALMREVIEGARALGFEIPDSFVEENIARTRGMGAYRPSSLIDFLEGRAVEVEAIWGEPLRRATSAGAAMPELARLYGDIRQAVS